jgi:hypothetical protein
MAIRGIDVASYQSETPDLDGMDFCFVKATEGTSYVNPKMRAQADHARAAGRVVGFYHFLRPGSMRAQARYFVDKCASRHGDPLWADWEDSGVSCADKDAFLREVARLRGDTHKVGLYCNTDFWLHRDTTSYCGDALWIAVYNGRPGHPGIRHKWLFHQYTSDPIDTNLGAFASRDALRTWSTQGSARTSRSTSEESTMALDLHTHVPVNDWLQVRWKDLRDGHIELQTALGSGYGHARRAGDASEANAKELAELRREVKELRDVVAALDLAALDLAGFKKALQSLRLRIDVQDGGEG